MPTIRGSVNPYEVSTADGSGGDDDDGLLTGREDENDDCLDRYNLDR